jgi:hypothetical protein
MSRSLGRPRVAKIGVRDSQILAVLAKLLRLIIRLQRGIAFPAARRTLGRVDRGSLHYRLRALEMNHHLIADGHIWLAINGKTF